MDIRHLKTLRMIRDAGFEILCDEGIDIEGILSSEAGSEMKGVEELRPTQTPA